MSSSVALVPAAAVVAVDVGRQSAAALVTDPLGANCLARLSSEVPPLPGGSRSWSDWAKGGADCDQTEQVRAGV